ISSTRLSPLQYLNETVNKGTIDMKMPTPERLLPIGHPRNINDIDIFDRRDNFTVYFRKYYRFCTNKMKYILCPGTCKGRVCYCIFCNYTLVTKDQRVNDTRRTRCTAAYRFAIDEYDKLAHARYRATSAQFL
ncbi:unnamed protein product, partial [Trichogramma brassicae]